MGGNKIPEETLWRKYWTNVVFAYNQLAKQVNLQTVTVGEFSPETVKEFAQRLYKVCKTHQKKLDTLISLEAKAIFSQSVLKSVSRIPWGYVLSYGQVAQHVENPRAGRAVGNIMRRNPLPFIVPCHRIVRNNGSIGGFMGGLQGTTIKTKLLRMEDIIVENGRLDLKHYGADFKNQGQL